MLPAIRLFPLLKWWCVQGATCITWNALRVNSAITGIYSLLPFIGFYWPLNNKINIVTPSVNYWNSPPLSPSLDSALGIVSICARTKFSANTTTKSDWYLLRWPTTPCSSDRRATWVDLVLLRIKIPHRPALSKQFTTKRLWTDTIIGVGDRRPRVTSTTTTATRVITTTPDPRSEELATNRWLAIKINWAPPVKEVGEVNGIPNSDSFLC